MICTADLKALQRQAAALVEQSVSMGLQAEALRRQLDAMLVGSTQDEAGMDRLPHREPIEGPEFYETGSPGQTAR